MFDTDTLSPRRQELSSFERCYKVGIQERRQSGRHQYVVRTGDPLRPFRTTGRMPSRDEQIVTLIA